MSRKPVFYNVDDWIDKNKEYFLPPVCNKMMHTDGQLKVFFVGGPNQRKDYHMEEGEELFYQLKGDMCLKVVEQGKHRDIIIKEGQVFLLPGRIAHSPNRVGNTVGLVIERERHHTEKDALRYYVENAGTPTLDSLYEEWFHCTDLGSQLVPVIERFFASEQYKTGIPKPGALPEHPPYSLDNSTQLQEPFYLDQWLEANMDDIDVMGSKPLFSGYNQFEILVYGKGEASGKCDNVETFIWQLKGTSAVCAEDDSYTLHLRDTLLIPPAVKWTMKLEAGSYALVCYQDPTRKSPAQ